MYELLILDLDDTIFETKSIERSSVSELLCDFESLLSDISLDKSKIQSILQDLWVYPFDQLSQLYGLDSTFLSKFNALIQASKFNFNIQVFPDYHLLQALSIRKVLVTTGFSNIQHAKIDALGIRKDFSDIIIDELSAQKRKKKFGIFQDLLRDYSISPNKVLVIGDNCRSEIQAAVELGITSVQMCLLNQEPCNNSDYVIGDYQSLVKLLKRQAQMNY